MKLDRIAYGVAPFVADPTSANSTTLIIHNPRFYKGELLFSSVEQVEVEVVSNLKFGL